jgi:two-component system, cell cycle response regulator
MSNAFQEVQCLQTASILLALQEHRDRAEFLGHTENSPSESLKILVVDDSPLYRSLLEGALAQERYNVSFARNGREALKIMTEHRPALVITDWEMPDISGVDLCRAIREEHDFYTYVILLTGNSDKDRVIEGLASGADDYLTKPFHSGELLARVAVGRRMVELNRQIHEKNRQLQELALTDPLTSLPNRRAIEEWTKRALKSAERHGFPFWIVLADIDHFKSINDNYGHESGDTVLKRFANLLLRHTRSSNICGRIGGEEFVMALTHVAEPGVQVAVDRFREQLEAERFSLQGNVAKITASFGIAGFHGERAPTLDELLRIADAALYEAKRKGRNRLEFAP